MTLTCGLCLILLVFAAEANSKDISNPDVTCKSVNKGASGVFINDENHGYAWPPPMLKDNSQDSWGRDVMTRKLHDWPSVLPWAKLTNRDSKRYITSRKRRRNVFGERSVIDIEPKILNIRHKVALPKLMSEGRK